MKINEIQVGMRLDGITRRFDYEDELRVEHVAYDYAVVRGSDNRAYLVTDDDDLELYVEGKYD